MVSSKVYCVLVILSIFIAYAISTEEKTRKSDSAIDDNKKRPSSERNGSSRQKSKPRDEEEIDFDDIDDNHSGLSSYADDRYSGFGNSDINYRTRPRWPTQRPSSSLIDDAANEWPTVEFPSQFQLASMSLDKSPMLNNAPVCQSLIDPQYPIFSDVCGAIPQAKYSLPNALGHRDKWQIAQVLTSLMSSTTDQSCTRSLRLLLCPALFPTCQTRHESTSVLPCQSFCHAVKSRCAIPALEALSCEILPYTSDICPSNPAYAPFIPQGAAFPTLNQGLPIPTGFSPSNFASPQSLVSLQSLLSGQGFQTPSAIQSLFSTQAGLQQQQQQPSPLPSSPSNIFNNAAQYSPENLAAMLADFSAQANGYDYRQNARYGSKPRQQTETRPSSNEIRSQVDPRFANKGIPSGIPSIVKA